MTEIIERYWIFAVGFFAQGLFGIRVLSQWYLSEKEKRSVSPVIFWQISLAASFVFIIYGILRRDFVIIFGQLMAYVIYVRNLQLNHAWRIIPLLLRVGIMAMPAVAVLWIFVEPTDAAVRLDFQFMVLLGTIGQVLFNIRFIYQWYHAEKTKISTLPLGFWIMTAVGSMLVLAYAVDKLDPVLLFAQGFGFIASLRNIWLYLKTAPVEP
jgi:lipid-A-disaccharide synthase-like uncharacterized protein